MHESAIQYAGELIEIFSNRFVVGDLFDNESIWENNRHYSLAFVMPGRLIEQGGEKADRLLMRLSEQCDHIVAYAYGDWIERYTNLTKLAEAAGLTVISTSHVNGAALVKVAR